MNFKVDRQLNSPYTAFSVIVSDMEFTVHRESVLAKRFIEYLLRNLANMIAGWYFKNHKEDLIKWLDTEECKLLVAKTLAERIELKLNNELVNGSSKTTR